MNFYGKCSKSEQPTETPKTRNGLIQIMDWSKKVKRKGFFKIFPSSVDCTGKGIQKEVVELLFPKVYPFALLTHCIMVVHFSSPFLISGVSGLFRRFYSNFDGEPC